MGLNKYLFLVVYYLLFSSCLLKERNHVDGSLQPSIVFKEVIHDFGNIEEGIKVSHNFQFSNSGDDTLRIKRVKGG